MASTAWRGAVEFAGFPVNLALYSRIKKQRNESFKTMTPDGESPVASVYIDPRTDEQVARDKTKKAHVIGSGKSAKYHVLTDEAIEQIGSGVKTTIADLHQLAPVDTIAWDLAIDRFAVRPDENVPGAEKSVNVLWNGLREMGVAYVSQISTSGGMDSILALYATDNGLWGVLLPFEQELNDVPTHAFIEDEQAAAVFEQFAAQAYGDKIVERFDHSAFQSEYKARRKAAIDACLAGEPVVVDEPVEQESAVPDLMAALTAATAAAKPKVKPAAKGRKKVAA